MYIDSSSVSRNGKTYTRHLLRESYREEGKVKHRTFANLSHCSSEEIEAMRLALRHKGNLSLLGVSEESINLHRCALPKLVLMIGFLLIWCQNLVLQ